MIKQIRTVVVIAILCVLSGCNSAPAAGLASSQAKTVPALTASSGARDTHENLNSILWMQTSVEYQIACQTVFNNARNALDQALLDPEWTAALEQTGPFQSLPPAIVLDIDDTMLDNTLFYGRLVNDRRGYDFNLWKEWVERSEAPPTPGAADFAFYAASKGVVIFYITNRDSNMESATRRNLSRLGVNLSIGEDTVLMNGEKPGWTSDKSSRRAYIAEKYRILLLVGDDLGDFVPGARGTLESREKLAAQYHNQWGRRWFLMPNPGSGSWERALYDDNPDLSDTETLRRKFEAIQYYGAPVSEAARQETPIIIPDMTVTFNGDQCLYDGPDKIYSGKLTIRLVVKERMHPSYGLFLATLDQGKTMQDLIDWKSLDQPPWVHAVDDKIVNPGSPTIMSPIVTEGPLYLICFGFNPDAFVGRWGPIEVKR